MWGLCVHSKQPTFYTASDDKTLRAWSARDHSLTLMARVDQQIRSVAVSPDGAVVAAGLRNGSFAVFSAKDLKEVC